MNAKAPPREILSELPAPSTAAVCDALIQLGQPLRVAPHGLAPVRPGIALAGAVAPVRHAGSVDDIIQALQQAPVGAVAVVDNDGRTDEGCVGDLLAMEAIARAVAGFVVYGCHRDHDRLVALGLPVFSYGRAPAGPPAPRSRRDAPVWFGPVVVDHGDVVVADADGAVFISSKNLGPVFDRARHIEAIERRQAAQLRRGATLYDLCDFPGYVARRHSDPSYDFRTHLRTIGAEVEA
jgi:4-hydroxy-4-methyl-2-oxoglutarate aldolase